MEKLWKHFIGIALLLLIIVCELALTRIIGVPEKQSRIVTLNAGCLNRIPGVVKIMQENPEVSELLKHMRGVREEDFDLLMKNPDFVKYLEENITVVKVIISDPDPHEKLLEVFKELTEKK